MIDSERYKRLTELFRDGSLQISRMGRLTNEALTRQLLITPMLEELGYTAFNRIPEYQEQNNTPDEVCYLRQVSANPGDAAIILEAKNYGTNFDHAAGPRASSPNRQIQRYLQQHSASGPNTIGVLTDGVRWRIYRRTGDPNTTDIEFIVEHNFQYLADVGQFPKPDAEAHIREILANLFDLLAREQIGYRTIPGALIPSRNRAELLFEAIKEDHSPESVLSLLLPEPNAIVQIDLAEDVTLTGIRKDAHDNDWENYAYARAVPMKTSPMLGELGLVDHAVIAAVQLHHDERGLGRADIALCARAFASVDPSQTAIVLAYAVDANGNIEARFASASGNQVNMTVEFDPSIPSPSASAAINEVLQTLHDPSDDVTADKLLDPLEVAPLRQRFYGEVARWVGDLQRGKNRSQRQAILLHLIRVIFAWILKEEDIIPPELFEEAFIIVSFGSADGYHADVLRFLFLERLNMPNEGRLRHDNEAIHNAMQRVPFLNGSLFAEHSDDDELDIPADKYWNTDPEKPGLFTILSRYHWTLNEHRPGESEQTLDPELLSNLFERLIAPTEEGSEPPLRQPKGTYYTPADVADEMVEDALAAAVRKYAPSDVTEAQLLGLFGNGDASIPSLTNPQRNRLLRRISQLRIFDPAVGSGEFLFSALTALQRALHKLERDAGSVPTPAVDITERQLSGQDISPLAVQIARLRLFIAIIADRKGLPPAHDRPLPNLEARIVCADTLQTFADPQWRPDHPGQFDTADPELVQALTDLAANRARWFDAYTEQEKQERLNRDVLLRDRLRLLLQNKGDLASPELIGFADFPLFNIHPTPARTDARLLFYENPWRGFDIVIGNPPYEALSKSMSHDGIDVLKTNKHYRTTNVRNLYSLFCETALALADSNGGVVTMIVPFSIAFGQRQKTLRDIFNASSETINLRHHDNRPDTTFNASPTVKSPENRQRATIMTSVLGKSGNNAIKSTGLQRWSAGERAIFLNLRPTTTVPQFESNVDVRIAGQWPRIPTKKISDLVRTVLGQRTVVESLRSNSAGETLAFPMTAYQFIASIPRGTVHPRSETYFPVNDMDSLRLVMATLNGHIAYGWWWVFGDGFHVKPYDLTSLTVPDAWMDNPRPAIELGQRLIDAMPECEVVAPQQGNTWRNVDFHRKPDLIEELDRLHISALGLEPEPLLRHLRIMRSSSSWSYD